MSATIYVSHPIGNGGTLSETEKSVNRKKAFRFVNWMREKFPQVKYYCPAEAEAFVTKALDKRSDCCKVSVKMIAGQWRNEHEEPTGVCAKCGKECTAHSFLNLDQVLEIDCEIIRECEGLIAYAPSGKTSKDMDIEIEFANAHGIPVLNLWYCDDIKDEKLFSLISDFIMESIDG